MSQLSTRFLHVCRFFVLLLGMGAPAITYGQATAPDDFGQNRIQYKRFNWQYYSTQNFNIYFSEDGRQLARNAADHAERELKRITSVIGYYPYSKITIILYNSVSDMKQSNIGLIDDPYKGGNDALFVKSKIEVAFEGSQTELKRQMTYRISELLLSDMMYGGSLKEVIQSNYLLRLPEWFVSGAAAYLAEGWSVDMDDYMRDMIQKTGGKRPDPLFARNQRVTGQAIWNYITERHGAAAIQNILNLTRITRDIEVGIASSLNMPYKRFSRDWFAYYTQMNTFADATLPSPSKENKIKKGNARQALYSEPALSPSGQKLAFVIYDRGAYKVFVRNLSSKSQRVVYRGGYKMPNQEVDPTVPLLSWRSETQLGISDVRRGKLQLKLQSANQRYIPGVATVKNLLGKTKNVLPLSAYSQVVGVDFSEDGQHMVLSAVKNGQTDLYLYRNGRLVRQLTDDVFDDLQPSFLPGTSNRIVFSSNRYADSLQSSRGKFSSVTNNYDIYLFDPNNAQSRFWQLTYTPSNEVMPIGLSEDEIMYLGEETGIRSLYRHNIKTGSIARVTDFRQNIKTYDYNAQTGNLTFVANDRAKEFLYWYPSSPLQAVAQQDFKTRRQQVLEGNLQRRIQQENARVAAALAAKAAADSLAALRITQVPDSTGRTPDSTAVATAPAKTPAPAAKPRTIMSMASPDSLVLNYPRPYDLRFGVNSLLTSVYADPLLGFGFVMEVGMADLFEDYRIRGGVFALTDLRTTNFYAEYSNLKNRYDYRVGFQKQSIELTSTGGLRTRLAKYEILPAFSYPLTNALSVKVLPRFANVRAIAMENFAEPDQVTDLAGIGGEIVYDNSVVTGMNMREGTRMKVGISRMYGIKNKPAGFGNFYVDIRHYQKIHKEFVWANRLSYEQSFGPAPKRHKLGGVDNWINADDDDSLAMGPVDYLFMNFATPMRGFNYGARNGTRYVLWNSELRLPVFQYLFEGPINSGFFRNLQLVGFFDAGTAYDSGNPFSDDNSVNTQPVPRPPFQVIVRNFRNPFMYGYGFGARTTLLGVYGRFDMAWGERNLKREGPKFYFSMGYDF
ncbi:hypothetical protein ACFSC6_10285 [Rufibacter sediminis]|uniref:Translocation protein TolB n=1 Tax=Rufibacter sediminis TaxID=2762756 RepID=A0ABR6VX05_9BACT|nr:hypothetical protein [Rufibacter sediminis]MBC3541722.1 hypothetical protein [Rufibacter sediminis]